MTIDELYNPSKHLIINPPLPLRGGGGALYIKKQPQHTNFTMNKTVGVVLALFNGEKYINKQIESIFNQTLLPDQLIIVDDCSRDNSVKIAENWKSKYPDRIKIFKNIENMGYARNFEKGISLCNTDFIALCDQDDIWIKDKLQKCVKALSTDKNSTFCYHNADLIYCDGFDFGKSLNYFIDEKFPLEIPKARKSIFNNFPISPIRGFTIMFSINVKKYFFPIPGEKFCSHDWWLCAISFFIFNPVYLDESLAKYRIHHDQASGPASSLLKNTPYALKKRITFCRIITNIKKEIIRILNHRKKNKQRRIDKDQQKRDIKEAFDRLKIIINECDHLSREEKTIRSNMLDAIRHQNCMN